MAAIGPLSTILARARRWSSFSLYQVPEGVTRLGLVGADQI
jgi:hypothetical protein